MRRRIIRTPTFKAAFERLHTGIRKVVEEKIRLLAENPAHPSLQVHRLRRARAQNVWICYISINKRLLYQYKGHALYLWDVGEHCVVERIRQNRFS
jgi:mRNA interferase RelE/StbE